VNSSSDTRLDLQQHKVVRERRYQLRRNPEVNPENDSQCIPGILAAYDPVGGIGVRFPSIRCRALSSSQDHAIRVVKRTITDGWTDGWTDRRSDDGRVGVRDLDAL
jgi:hypothetical protein